MKALVVDDERTIRETLTELLEMEGFDVANAGDIKSALKSYERDDIHLMISDQRLPDGNGLDLLRQVRDLAPETDVFIITGWGNIELAVEAMRQGAVDFLTKPLDMNTFITRIRKWRREKNEKDTGNIIQFHKDTLFEGVIGSNPKMRKAIELMQRVAPSDVAVLIRGETGTGKELIAKGIHDNSLRCDGPFINVNCAAIPDNLLESELFGYEKGAFTGAASKKRGKFELAQGGTIFLDEIGDLSFNTQAKLLRVLQDRKLEPLGAEISLELDVRVVTATNKNLEEMVAEEEFRQDLYYRLNVVTIYLPPLLERLKDIPELTSFFIQKYNDKLGKSIKGVAPGVLDMFKGYSWPGNIRELSNTLERAVLLAQNDRLNLDDFNLPVFTKKQRTRKSSQNLRKAIEDMEKTRLAQALAEAGGNQVKAAQLLGMKRTTLRYKMQKYKLIA